MEYAELLCVLTVGPDANSAMDGIHRLLRDIVNHAVEPNEIGGASGCPAQPVRAEQGAEMRLIRPYVARLVLQVSIRLARMAARSLR